MPRRVNPAILLGIVIVAVLSFGLVASAQVLEGPVNAALEGPVEESIDLAIPVVEEQFAQGLEDPAGGTASDALGVGGRSSASPS